VHYNLHKAAVSYLTKPRHYSRSHNKGDAKWMQLLQFKTVVTELRKSSTYGNI